MHEIVHGLGFASAYRINTATRQVTKPAFSDDAYSYNVAWHPAPGLRAKTLGDFGRLTNARRFNAITSVRFLHFIGKSTKAAQLGMHANLYAPATVLAGSTLSHFDETTLPNEMMSPFATGIQQKLGMAANVLEDIGWGPVGSPAVYAGLNGTSFAVGSTMRLTINEKAGTPALVDKYVALKLPNGSFLFMQPNGGFSTVLNAWKRNYRPVSRTFSFSMFSYRFMGTSLAGAEPKGAYTWFVAFTSPGTLNFVSFKAIPFRVL